MSRRSMVGIGIVCLTFVIVIALLKFIAYHGVTEQQVRYDSIPTGQSDTLVVLVHGIGNRGSIEEVTQLAKVTFPSAHLLIPSYDRNPFSNASATVISTAIETTVTELDRRNNYKRIVLVGYSAGAVLVRKVYLWSAGQEEDRPVGSKLGVQPWAGRVERIVLIAGMNRGWSADDVRGFWSRQVVKSALWLARISGTGHLMRSMERGSPFIGNMRIQWIRLARSGASLPMVVQLIGGRDAVVSPADSRDVAAHAGFLFIPVGGETDHTEILKFNQHSSDPNARFAGDIRYRAVRTALSELPEEVRKVARPLPDDSREDPSITRYVFVKHGIRDFGEWTERIGDEIMKRDHTARVDASHYDYFPMGAFLLFNARQSHVRELVDAYTEALAKYPNAQFDYFGHSNGTYLLASALDRYPTIQFHRVVFAGSVAPIAYDWGSKIRNHQVVDVVNIVGSADWVVGIFPHLFELLGDVFGRSTKGMFDIGAAGFRGFAVAGDVVHNVYYAAGTHDAGFGDHMANVPTIVNYLLDLSPSVHLTNEVGKPSWFVDLFSKLCILIWALILGTLYIGGAALAKVTWRGALRPRLSWTCYVGVLLVILNFI